MDAYVSALRAGFSEFALFFAGCDAGSGAPAAVGVVWRPNAFQPRPFNLRHVRPASRVEVGEDGEARLTTNPDELLQQMVALGGGLVSGIM